jgi:hypothetical protein
MKKVLVYIFVLSFFTFKSYSQGFDWQYDMRLPFDYPEYFLSFSVNYGLAHHNGDFDFLENGISCCNFESGNGNLFDLNAGIEYWYKGNVAIFADIGYSSVSGNFSNRTSVPRAEDYILTTEYQYDAALSIINLNLGGKYRLSQSHFFGGVAINTEIIANQENNFREIKISPVTDPFKDRDIPAGEITGLRTLIFNLQLLAGYDVNIGKGKYISAYMKFNQQINSFVDDKKWYRTSLVAGVKFNKGIFFTSSKE